ncbi:MAG: type II toxin-antitoxin system VapC family toxin [Deltaproteobacteria bacterium]|nr:type II toxin-antitoxin system VapC family toxin [Deltaproteobacteria bacterium]
MRLILDTCVISETVRRMPEPKVLHWLEAQRETDLYLSVLTIGEIHKGIARLDDEKRKEALGAWVDGGLADRFGTRLLPVDCAVAACWGEIQGRAERTGRRMPVIDGMIAATALVHGLAVATRNGNDMVASGVTVIDPWTAPP